MADEAETLECIVAARGEVSSQASSEEKAEALPEDGRLTSIETEDAERADRLFTQSAWGELLDR